MLPSFLFDLSRHRHYLVSILIAVLGLLVYSNTYHVGFQPDDQVYILKNPFVTRPGLSLDGVRQYGELYKTLSQRYVGYLSFALNYRLHGQALVGYHVVNNIVHILNGLLVYVLVLATFRTPLMKRSVLRGRAFSIALATACLFLVHPVQTEAVTYIMQRLASQTALFYLASLLLYVRGRLLQIQSSLSSRDLFGSAAHFVGSWILAVLAMKTKENAFTLPVMMALYEVTFFEGPWRKRMLILFPFVMTMLIIPLNSFHLMVQVGMTGEEFVGHPGITYTQNLLTQSTVIIQYIRLLLLPIGQNFDYDITIRSSFVDGPVILSVLAIAVLLVIAGYMYARARNEKRDVPAARSILPNADGRLIGFGIFWFFIAISIEAGGIPLPNAMCEYRLYLPSVGFLLALLALLFVLVERQGNVHWSRSFMVMIVCWTCILAVATYKRNEVWADQIVFWEDVVAKSPRKAKPHHNLGMNYMQTGKYDEAEREFRTALKLDASMMESHVNLGELYYREHRLDEAISEFLTVTDFYRSSYYYNMLAMAYDDAGRTADAVATFQRSLEIDPLNSSTHYHLGIAYARSKQFSDAIREFQAALEIDRDADYVWDAIGMVYDEMGRLPQAVDAFHRALAINPMCSETHHNLGLVLMKQRKIEEAINEYRSALNIDPNYSAARANLENAMKALRSSASKGAEQARAGK